MLGKICSWNAEPWDGRFLDTSGTEMESQFRILQKGNSWWEDMGRNVILLLRVCVCFETLKLLWHNCVYISDSSRDAGTTRQVSLWDQQQLWENVDQWSWCCDRYVTLEDILFKITIEPVSLSIYLSDYLPLFLTESTKDISPDFRGNGVLWR